MSTGGRVVVLGASGYLGCHVLRALAARWPGPIRAVSRRPAACPPQAAGRLEIVTGDVTDPQVLPAVLNGADAVVHLVADIDRSGGRGWRVAEGGAPPPGDADPTVGLVAALRTRAGAPLVVWTGSATQVGDRARTRIDGTEPDRPDTTYDRRKLAAERRLLAADAEGVLRAVPLRLPTVYGPAAPGGSPGSGVVAAMVRRAAAGEPLTLWNDGTVVRDLLHVGDAAAAVCAALVAPPAGLAGRPWLLGTGRGVALRTLFEAIARLTAEATGRAPVPVCTVAPPGFATTEDFRGIEVDSAPFRRATGWRPAVDLDAGLRDTVRAHLAAC